METILVGENELEKYLDESKKALESGEVLVKGKGRDTVKAVDVAEMLKLEGASVKSIDIKTEETDGKRVSVIEIVLTK
jgi:DNA-binding protein Alba